MHFELLISGFKIGGPCDQSVGKDLIRNPWDESVVGTVAEGGWSELSTAIAAAQDAFDQKLLFKIDRKEFLNRVAELLLERKQELATLAVLEIGKPITMAIAEVERTARTFRLAAEAVDSLNTTNEDLSYDPRSVGLSATIQRLPLGVIFAITPYNWPFNLAAHKIAPALASGNSVVLKPHPAAAGCSLALAHLIQEAGCPPGALNCWNGPTPVVAKGLKDPRIKLISFTGSEAVGWKLREDHWRTPMVLELGANAPVVVCDSAEISDAIEKVVVSAYGYAGQVCISAQNLFVQDQIYSHFRERLIDRVRQIKCADPSVESTLCGPMISASAVSKVQQGVAGLNQVVFGISEKSRIDPILVDEPPLDHPIHREEIFGPVLTINRFSELTELVSRLNKRPRGINSSLFTKSLRDVELFGELNFPTLNVNHPPSLRFDSLPYGGKGTSGLGREGVQNSILEMTSEQVIVKPKLEP